MSKDRPQAPGYLANLMARLFHDVSGAGLAPLGIRAGQFPVLVQLWFGGGATRAGLVGDLEMDAPEVDKLVRSLAEDGLIATYPGPAEALVLTDKALAARDDAVQAARRANQAASAVLSEDEMAAFIASMNKVIDALQAARR